MAGDDPLSRRAAHQLAAILDNIEAHSPQGAENVMNRIEALLGVLATQPLSGRTTNRAGNRRVVVHPYPYAIVYKANASEIIIHGVRHTARRPRCP